MECAFDETKLADAVKDPRSTFGSPSRVVGNEQLSDHDKTAILESWMAQEKLLAEHAAENGRTDHESLKDSVATALDDLKNNS
ncbi:MAG: hypothetical protein HKN11_16675 [Rhizobiales bacterium]|nr:hypothetical protein [Hyphomicrobiales bacterium]